MPGRPRPDDAVGEERSLRTGSWGAGAAGGPETERSEGGWKRLEEGVGVAVFVSRAPACMGGISDGGDWLGSKLGDGTEFRAAESETPTEDVCA